MKKTCVSSNARQISKQQALLLPIPKTKVTKTNNTSKKRQFKLILTKNSCTTSPTKAQRSFESRCESRNTNEFTKNKNSLSTNTTKKKTQSTLRINRGDTGTVTRMTNPKERSTIRAIVKVLTKIYQKTLRRPCKTRLQIV